MRWDFGARVFLVLFIFQLMSTYRGHRFLISFFVHRFPRTDVSYICSLLLSFGFSWKILVGSLLHDLTW